MIIVVGCNKGGAGKTTTAINLTVALALKNKDVCLVDADPQRSASKWQLLRESENIQPAINLVEKRENIASTLLDLDSRYDFIIVDVAGRNSREFITGCSVADIVISPHQCSQQDLDTLLELEEQLERIKDLNPKLQVYCYQTLATTNPIIQGQERHDFVEYLSEINNIKLLDSIAYYRRVYRTSYSDGKSVIEKDNEKAREEISNLLNELDII